MGSLIVIEGLDGSGKATQAKLLAATLAAQGEKVREVSFPNYDSPSSALVKMYLAGEFGDKPTDVNAFAASAFYAVDRYASYKKDWAGDYAEGVIVADRYTTSNAIHQCSKLPREQWDEFLDWLYNFEYHMLGIPAPTIVVYLRVDPAVSQKLMRERYHGEDKRDIHEKDVPYLARCQAAADYCAKKLGWKIVECAVNDNMRSIETIQKEIADIIAVCVKRS
jgi:dTMP kinase